MLKPEDSFILPEQKYQVYGQEMLGLGVYIVLSDKI